MNEIIDKRPPPDVCEPCNFDVMLGDPLHGMKIRIKTNRDGTVNITVSIVNYEILHTIAIICQLDRNELQAISLACNEAFAHTTSGACAGRTSGDA